jgi:hypothetical protein
LREKADSDDVLRAICQSRNIILDGRDNITERGLMIFIWLIAQDQDNILMNGRRSSHSNNSSTSTNGRRSSSGPSTSSGEFSMQVKSFV